MNNKKENSMFSKFKNFFTEEVVDEETQVEEENINLNKPKPEIKNTINVQMIEKKPSTVYSGDKMVNFSAGISEGYNKKVEQEKSINPQKTEINKKPTKLNYEPSMVISPIYGRGDVHEAKSTESKLNNYTSQEEVDTIISPIYGVISKKSVTNASQDVSEHQDYKSEEVAKFVKETLISDEEVVEEIQPQVYGVSNQEIIDDIFNFEDNFIDDHHNEDFFDEIIEHNANDVVTTQDIPLFGKDD